jgi:phospholipase C
VKTRLSRREFLGSGAVAGAGLLLGDMLPTHVAAATKPAILPPTDANAPFDHVVVCMMENRSFSPCRADRRTRRCLHPAR